MRVFAPKYYLDFECIAERCKHSCCVGWEIDIDALSLSRYKEMKELGDSHIYASIDFSGEDLPHFKLKSDGRCPHLCDTGLCNIILNHGEGALCDICREHPRFYNRVGDFIEAGIGAVCEEAARLILGCEDYKALVEIGERNEEVDECDFEDICGEKVDTGAERDKIYRVLSDESLPYGQRLLHLWEIYECPPSAIDDEAWRELLSSIEYLNEDSAVRFAKYSSKIENHTRFDKQLERYLAYLIYRHLPKATERARLRSVLGFCFFTERLLASLLKASKKPDTGTAHLLARLVSEEIEYSLDNTAEIMTEFEFI